MMIGRLRAPERLLRSFAEMPGATWCSGVIRCPGARPHDDASGVLMSAAALGAWVRSVRSRMASSRSTGPWRFRPPLECPGRESCPGRDPCRSAVVSEAERLRSVKIGSTSPSATPISHQRRIAGVEDAASSAPSRATGGPPNRSCWSRAGALGATGNGERRRRVMVGAGLGSSGRGCAPERVPNLTELPTRTGPEPRAFHARNPNVLLCRGLGAG